MSLVFQNVRLPLASFELVIDLRLAAPVTALFGPSGSGKTTLLEIVTGLHRPAAGRVLLDDIVLCDAAARLHLPPSRRAIGYVPQDGALFPHLSVRQNLLYGLRAPAESNQTRAAGLAFDHVVEVLEIGALAERPIATLSGGEKQRVALGRALLSAPRLLLLDEPLAGLDLPLRDRLVSYLRRVRDEFRVPMIHVTHSPDEVMALSDEVLLLNRGKPQGQGTPDRFFLPDASPHYRLRTPKA